MMVAMTISIAVWQMKDYSGEAETLPLAICKAALKTVGIEID